MPSAHTYKTRQRQIIENCLKENSGKHLTVDDIIDILKAENSEVGRTTVYRTLEKLAAENKVRRYTSGSRDSSCYQYVDSSVCCEHFHLKCVCCGRLLHLNCEHMRQINEHILKEHGFFVDTTKTVLYGECEECRRKNK